MKKEFAKYLLFVITGLIIDYSLIHYHLNIPYSFMMLFLQVSLYNIKYKQMLEDSKLAKVIIQLFVLVVLPVIFGIIR